MLSLEIQKWGDVGGDDGTGSAIGAVESSTHQDQCSASQTEIGIG